MVSLHDHFYRRCFGVQWYVEWWLYTDNCTCQRYQVILKYFVTSNNFKPINPYLRKYCSDLLGIRNRSNILLGSTYGCKVFMHTVVLTVVGRSLELDNKAIRWYLALMRSAATSWKLALYPLYSYKPCGEMVGYEYGRLVLVVHIRQQTLNWRLVTCDANDNN